MPYNRSQPAEIILVIARKGLPSMRAHVPGGFEATSSWGCSSFSGRSRLVKPDNFSPGEGEQRNACGEYSATTAVICRKMSLTSHLHGRMYNLLSVFDLHTYLPPDAAANILPVEGCHCWTILMLPSNTCQASTRADITSLVAHLLGWIVQP